ncbi:hypothetical protein, partial [Facilibium subflavum]|uniref:hypothetical protein n=1 Tax=Facilibium subflavum TaxID=2219058 RepID=UPI001AACA34D
SKFEVNSAKNLKSILRKHCEIIGLANLLVIAAQQQGSAEFRNLVHNYQQDSADQFKQEFLANKTQLESSTGAQIQHNTDAKVGGVSDINSTYQANNNAVANQYGQSRSGFENRVNNMDQNVANKAVRETLGQYGLKGNTFNSDNPSSFNRQMVMPPKMNVSVDAQGQDLRSRADALRSDVMENKKSYLDKTIESSRNDASSALGVANLNANAATENGKLGREAWSNYLAIVSRIVIAL